MTLPLMLMLRSTDNMNKLWDAQSAYLRDRLKGVLLRAPGQSEYFINSFECLLGATGTSVLDLVTSPPLLSQNGFCIICVAEGECNVSM